MTTSKVKRPKRKSTYQHKQWAKQVKEKDGHQCVVCGSSERLEAHHLNDYSNYPDERYSIENGVSLCNTRKGGKKCHYLFHVVFKGGYRRKTSKADFERFVKLSKVFTTPTQ